MLRVYRNEENIRGRKNKRFCETDNETVLPMDSIPST